MKNFLFYLLCFFILLFSFSNISAQEGADGNYYKAFVTENNLDLALLEMEIYYDQKFGGYGLPEGDTTIQIWTRDLLTALLDQADVDSIGCDSGLPVLAGAFDSGAENMNSNIKFDWFNSTDSCIGFFGAYLDFRTNNIGYTVGRDQSISLEIQGELPLKLFALNARCDSTQSGYFIIIIEKDISLTSMPQGPVPGNIGDPETRLKAPNKDLNFSVFPNPSTNGSFNLSFELKSEEVVSMDILDATTGRLVKQVLDKEHMKVGAFEKHVSLNLLLPNIYYVVLQTSEKRIIQKLIIL